jgi:glycosyltransferase involved in cell wall biosynthesis
MIQHRKVRVLHVAMGLGYGGMERLLFEMIRRSDRDRFEYHVLNLEAIGRFGQGLDEYASVKLAKPQSALSLLRPVGLKREIAEIAPDVVHSHSGVWYKASRAARMAGVPRVVHTEHGRALSEPWLDRRLDALASARTDCVVAVSNAVADILKTRIVKHPERVSVIENGVDVERFRPMADDGSIRAELRIPALSPILGSIGRLEPVKGYEVMVDAFAHLMRGWNGSARPVLVIAGDGSERQALVERAAGAGIADDVRWIGWRDDIHALHSAFDLFTMSSHSEGTSVSLLEAMSAQLCPIVTDVGGNAAVLGSTLRHRLVPPRDPAALATAWGDALAEPGRRSADAATARARVLEAFTLDSMVRAYERLYEGSASPASDLSA